MTSRVNKFTVKLALSHHQGRVLVLNAIRSEHHLPHVVERRIALADELVEDGGCVRVVLRLGLLLGELVLERLGLPGDLAGKLLVVHLRDLILDSLIFRPAALRADLEQVCADSFLGYR